MKVGTTQILSNNKINNSNVNGRELNETAQNNKHRNKHEKTAGSIYAGDLNVNQDLVANKKAMGQKQAIKKILDAFSRELNVDAGVQEIKNQRKELNTNVDEYKDKIKSVQEMKGDIQKSYGVSGDSEEQKNLDVLIKANNNPDTLSEDEKSRLVNMGPLTDYQKEILKVSSMETYWSKKMETATSEIADIGKVINEISIERLKTHSIVDAGKDAQEIAKGTAKEVAGMLLDEAVDKTDEKLEDNTKTDESKKEDAVQAEKKPEEAGDETDSMEDIAQKQEKVLREIKKQAQKSNLSMEDIKGILVDAQS
ncbi:hypothetical protein [Anaerocolumna xylanovorans]|uniref:Uncharacterized protein n=1 Tax=Anaerocolumna xylanovorans DSM 12503 TaxID=1121345 RepID=A0A1M7Y6R7_9FIRM|nr:hypothetical protein [Anaerocolumna xylanovorans]SHO48206.1 hypothetical protein SAMN02745217_01719 [Anaerocolumna xylanovorans DSM 12503]